jgi:hypothetical protein
MGIAKQDLTKLIQQAVVKMNGASVNAIKAELFDVLTEFFDISSAWQERLDLDLTATTAFYDLVPSEGQIIRLIAVIGNTTYQNTAALVAAENANGGQAVGGWTNLRATLEDPTDSILHIHSPPNSAQAGRVYVVKNVVLPTTKDLTPIAPDWVLPKWGRYILDGVLGKMMGTPNKSYTSDAQSVYHLKRFQEGISRARTATLSKNTHGAQAWLFPREYSTRSQRGYASLGTDRSF